MKTDTIKTVAQAAPGGCPVASRLLAGLPLKREYVAAWQRAKSLPTTAETKGFQWWPQPIHEILLEFSEALQKRINLRAGLPEVQGRKDNAGQTTRWRRDQRRLDDIRHRVRVYQFETEECRLRFSHLLATHCD